jgi:hypothetical protein
MAVVTTYNIISTIWRTQDPPNIAPNIHEIGKLGFEREHYAFNILGAGFSTDNTPISLLPSSLIVTRGKSHSFVDDYYNRIHILPSSIALGNLLSTQIRDIELWNAYFTPQLLSSLVGSGTDGITISEPISSPTTFASLESRIYNLNISINGSPVINAVYTFNFPLEDATLTVTGRRVVVWPFIPQTQHSETMEWLTDIIASFNNEQRLALRSEPRQSFTYEFQMDERQFSRAKAICTQWAHRVYAIAVWSEATYVGALSAGATVVFLDTAYADYREDYIFMIWESDTKFEAIENLEVLADRINLKLPLENAYTNAYVAPLRFARTLQGMEFRRRSDAYAIARGTFLVTQNADLGASIGYDTYKSKDVIPDRTILVNDLREKISRHIDMFDNGSGPIEIEIKNNWVNNIQTITFDTITRAERWAARQWIHSRRGKQKGFWLPTWNTDLVSVVNVNAASTFLTCLPIGYPLYYGVKDIMIQRTNGVKLYNRILSASTDGSGNELLNLENPVGEDLTVADIEYICFMSHVRFNTDRIDVRHSYAGRATMSIPVIETPES